MLEMDRLERKLVNLPLLQDPSSYIPDTVDLTEDALAREYWLYCFEEALDGVGRLLLFQNIKARSEIKTRLTENVGKHYLRRKNMFKKSKK